MLNGSMLVILAEFVSGEMLEFVAKAMTDINYL